MTNAEMFVYVHGILMKKGTINSWNEINRVIDNPVAMRWLNALYTTEELPGMNLDDLINSHLNKVPLRKG